MSGGGAGSGAAAETGADGAVQRLAPLSEGRNIGRAGKGEVARQEEGKGRVGGG